MECHEVRLSDPIARKCKELTGYKGRRPLRVYPYTSQHVRDFWDGGSRDYTYFIQLEPFKALPSSAMPADARQKAANPFNLPISQGEVTIRPGFAILTHSIFCGKDVGLSLYAHPDNIPKMLEAGTSGTIKCEIRLNEDKQGVEIIFSDRPVQKIITQCKAAKFRWSRKQGLWWRKDSPEARQYAEDIACLNNLLASQV